MRNLIRSALAAFRPPASRNRSIRGHQARIDAIARGVVRRSSTGNVRLQLGKFVLPSDLTRQFNRVKNYRFIGG